jgi:PhzF family phenazine biosynthesis protein
MTLRLPLYQVDAFTRRVLGGNPAAVVPLESWPDDALLQAIARENNLSETAYLVREAAFGATVRYRLRWFTPAVEVDLCGHATLASAFVLFERLEREATRLVFSTRSGELLVERQRSTTAGEPDLLCMDFPARARRPVRPADRPGFAGQVREALGVTPLELWESTELMAVVGSEAEVRELRPDLTRLAGLHSHGVIVTAAAAPGSDVDFVSRFFCPNSGVPEDPVTGSTHCTMVPYWAERLGRTRLHARQVSARSGDLVGEHRGDRVLLAGHAVLYLEGTLQV